MRACLNIRAPHVRWSLELQLLVSHHVGAGIGCSFSSFCYRELWAEHTPEQVLRQVHSLFLPATPLVWGSTSGSPAHAPFWTSTEGSSVQFLPELQTSSLPGPVCGFGTNGHWAGQQETGRQCGAWAGQNAASARNNLGTSSGQQVLPPHLLRPPQPPPQSLGASKRRRGKGGRV